MAINYPLEDAMTAATLTTNPLLAEHARLVSEREAATSPGTRAALMKKLNMAELELTLADVEFTPYVPPTQSAQSFANWTDAEVTAKHEQLISERRAATTPGKKAALTLAVKRIEAELERRGIKFVRASFANRSVAQQLDDESLLKRIHGVRAITARADIRPAIKATATRELRHLEDMASERGLSVSNGVAKPAAPIEVPKPEVDGGTMLDKTTKELAGRMAAPARKSRKAM